MRILKSILIALAVIFVIAGIGIYFLPNHYEVSKTIEINKPASVVYSQIADFSKWNGWDPWKEMDPSSVGKIEGDPGTIGHRMTWKGDKTGEGTMSIAYLQTNSSVNLDMEFLKPMRASAKSMWIIDEDKGVSKVTWSTRGGLKFPIGRLFGLTVDKILGGDQEHGLENLKKVCEAIPTPEPVASVVDTAEVIVQ
ncbi:MAG: SRPBCC family protein [Bacteroidetes bacterium]|nr:SRPBCC family protein [Bacteroidota bacterium]